jgi:hypothetical protein
MCAFAASHVVTHTRRLPRVSCQFFLSFDLAGPYEETGKDGTKYALVAVLTTDDLTKEVRDHVDSAIQLPQSVLLARDRDGESSSVVVVISLHRRRRRLSHCFVVVKRSRR